MDKNTQRKVYSGIPYKEFRRNLEGIFKLTGRHYLSVNGELFEITSEYEADGLVVTYFTACQCDFGEESVR